MQVEQILLFVVGILCVLASILNWNWWYDSRKVKFIVKILGRGLARLFYLVAGLVFLCVSIIDYLGIRDLL